MTEGQLRWVTAAAIVALGSGLPAVLTARGYSRSSTVLRLAGGSVALLTIGIVWSVRLKADQSVAFDKGRINEFNAEAWWRMALCSGVMLGAIALATVASIVAVRWRFRWGWLGLAVLFLVWLLLLPTLWWGGTPRVF